MIVGIDLGTTNSLVAAMGQGKPRILPNALGENLTPSVVGIGDDGHIQVGEAARQRLTTHPRLTTAGFKRYMGTDRTVKLGRRSFRAEELSALVLKSLKADAEAALGEPVSHAVISVPAYFRDAQRKATKAAGEIAGLVVDRLINEPTAAAIAYGLHDQLEESTFIVFDLGGGTFDASILELFDGVMQVHACAGDNYLGGDDFTEILLSDFVREHQLDAARLTPNDQSMLRRLAENAKISLSAGNAVLMKFVSQRDGKVQQTLQSDISPDRFNELVKPLIARLRTPIERALRDADLALSTLDAVVMVGGACRMPVIRQHVTRMFGRLPHATINFDETVALGAAIQAGLLEENASLDEIVLTDVMPYSLGVGIHNPNSSNPDELIFAPLIERNSPVPTSRVSDFYPVTPDQKRVEFGIYQGESRHVRDNVRLGAVTVPIKPGPVDDNRIDVRFTFNLNGILEVEIQNPKSGTQRRLIIEENPGVLTPAEIEKSLSALASLKIHPRDKLENVTLMNRANRLFEEHTGDKRNMISELISNFEAALASQDSQIEAEARAFVAERLNDLDDDPLGMN